MADPSENRWLLLIHQIPTKPAYLRVKIWRRLQRLGAVAVKNTVYALPRSEETQEHLQWVLREIVAGGGDASLCEARFIDGMTEDQVEAMFRAARDDDYAGLAGKARLVAEKMSGRRGVDDDQRAGLLAEVAQLKHRLAEVVALDFFGAAGRESVEGLVSGLERRLGADAPAGASLPSERARREDYQGRTWVTRRNIHVDRMASAWLIRRYIDPAAKLKFVPGKGYRPARGEVRFDMYEAELTHEGDRCTFEVLLARFGIDDAGLQPLAEIIHDIDLKDEKFGREDTPGFERMVNAIAAAHKEDEVRLARASAMLDDLVEYFGRRK